LCINTNTIVINIIVVLTGSKLCFTINRLYTFGFINAGNEIKKDEIGWACGTYGGEERCVQSLVGKPEGRKLIGRF